MPYDKISDLPNSQVDQYDAHQKKAFLEAFNNAEKEYHNEHQAFAVAHHAAKQAGKKEGRDSD
jgi:cation transport regulator